VSSLSGGERSRTALARLAAGDPNFLILDEPTNHLDLWACDALERALLAFDGTVLFVSHDRYFLNRVCDHVLVVEPGRFRTLEGNYESYVEMIRLRRQEDAAEAAAKAAAKPKQAVQAQAAKADEAGGKKDRRKRKFPYRKTAEIEADILDHETQIEEWQAKMILPETVRDGRLVKECHTTIEQLRAELAKLYEHWEEAAELN